MAETAISWATHSWNWIQGCRKDEHASESCGSCYMYREKMRYGQDPTKVVRTSDKTFNAPLKWPAGSRVFTCSWGDFFHVDADPWRADAWEIIRKRQDMLWMVLTKRASRIKDCLPTGWPEGFGNVWLGITAENQRRLDERWPHLGSIEAAGYWLSLEPMLSSITIPESFLRLGTKAFVVVEGQSGPEAVPTHPQWVRNVRDQCVEWGVGFHFKAWNEWAPFRDNGPLPEQCSYVGLDGTVRVGDAEDDSDACMARVGKGSSGRMLDGRTHDDVPRLAGER